MEFLNNSSWFMKYKTNGELFNMNIPQSHGENDFIIQSSHYSIDGKRLVTSSCMETNYYYSPLTLLNGDDIIRLPSRRSTIRSYSETSALIKAFPFDDYIKMDSNLYNNLQVKIDSMEEKDIKTIVKQAKKCKNIFYFYGHFIVCDDEEANINNIKEIVIPFFSETFSNLFKFRDYKTNNKFETYFSFIFKSWLFITQWENNELCLIDIVDIRKSKSFMMLLDYSENKYRDAILYNKYEVMK